MPDPIPPPQPISVPIVEPTYSNPISHYAGIVEDPNMDNSSMYRDEYADYGTYEEAGDASHYGS